MKMRILYSLALVVCFVGCDGLSSGGGGGVVIPTPTNFKLTLSVEQQKPATEITIVLTPDYELTVTKATANVTDIVLPLPDNIGCKQYAKFVTRFVGQQVRIGACEKFGNQPQLHFSDHYAFELTSGQASPPADNFILPVGSYRFINLAFGQQTNLTDDQTAMVVSGRLRDRLGIVTEPVSLILEIKVSQLEKLTVFPEASSDVTTQQKSEIVVNVSTDKWFEPIEAQLETCIDLIAEVTDVVEIDVEANDLPGACKMLSDTIGNQITDAASASVTGVHNKD